MRMFKRVSLLLTFALFLPFTSTSASGVPGAFAFSGSGYGHGVGMSQIGARAMALAGESATSILNYYYSGTQVETATDTQTLRINIGHLLTSAKFRSDTQGSALELLAGDISETATAAKLFSLPAKSIVTVAMSGSIISVSTTVDKKTSVVALGKAFTLRWSGTRYLDGVPSLVTVTQGSTAVKYRHGQIQIKVVRSKIHGDRMEITNSVRLGDEYLWGVSEVPSSWPKASLQAQAIASRTYALARGSVVKSACDCNLYGSISDQTFAGYSKESEARYGVLWKEAVTSTSGQIITNLGSPISAYFSSSTGGVTETSKNAWGTSTSYTLSVPDSASADVKLNPRFATWQRTLSQKVIADAFLVSDVATIKVISINGTGTVAQIEATTLAGKSVTLRGETFRSRTKLPSAWFTVNEELS